MKLKQDKYRRAREGYSRLLQVSCSKCKENILKYQKDGSGALLRMYFDRILFPKKLMNFEYKALKDIPPLKCPKCEIIVAHPYLYKKERRGAFRLFQDSISKKVIKL